MKMLVSKTFVYNAWIEVPDADDPEETQARAFEMAKQVKDKDWHIYDVQIKVE